MNGAQKNKMILFALILVQLFVSSRLNAQTDTTAFAYRQPLFDFDYAKPVFKLENEQLSNKSRFLRYSILTGYREGIKSIQGQFGTNFSFTEDKDRGTVYYKIYNVSILDMLVRSHIKQSWVILNVKDLSKYTYDPKYGPEIEWLRKNGYCFEFVFPIGVSASPDETYGMINKELSHFFNVKFGWEKRMVKTLVLVRTSNTDKIKGSRTEKPIVNENGSFRNVRISWLAETIRKMGSRMVKDETNYEGVIAVDLKVSDWNDIASLRKQLNQYDLDLKEEIREMNMFVVTEL